MMSRITERQLVLPALYLMSRKQNGFIKTSELITALTNVMRPTGRDAAILSNRSDTYFSQKVRNLKSHKTLQRYGYATQVDDGFQITQLGADYVLKHKKTLLYLFNNNFNYEDIKTSIGELNRAGNKKICPLEEIISEGRNITKSIQTHGRSTKLRLIALEYFSYNGVINCACCGFNFPQYYGEVYGGNCIEIHHIKPIFQYEDDSFETSVKKALQNLLPVCPNCHRVIHKNHIGSKDIDAFVKEIRRIKSRMG